MEKPETELRVKVKQNPIDNIISTVFDILNIANKNNVVTLLLATICINLVGYFYNWAVFYRYGFSYADFAAPSDFILGALNKPLVLFYSLSIAVLGAFGIMWSRLKSNFDESDYIPKSRFDKIAWYFWGRNLDSDTRRRQLTAFSATYLICGIIIVPMAAGYFLGSGDDSEFRFVCETYRGDKKIAAIAVGTLRSSTGSHFLITKTGSVSMIIPKSCVTSIETDF
ncbi:hypothetical protein [Roseibium sediminicola]|uniref:Uncharacterized protein n=1 Tax=Roseibium sediminicola TaxID=2933272 RepID=A0ABT0GRC5_9HYPH|nr:hypothetical protein [Roseibium sp. CAU 1639]MCK7612001.1 hypothetical protein [Roseibium sp. CAU 1639]